MGRGGRHHYEAQAQPCIAAHNLIVVFAVQHLLCTVAKHILSHLEFNVRSVENMQHSSELYAIMSDHGGAFRSCYKTGSSG